MDLHPIVTINRHLSCQKVPGQGIKPYLLPRVRETNKSQFVISQMFQKLNKSQLVNFLPKLSFLNNAGCKLNFDRNYKNKQTAVCSVHYSGQSEKDNKHLYWYTCYLAVCQWTSLGSLPLTCVYRICLCLRGTKQADKRKHRWIYKILLFTKKIKKQ